MGLRCVLSTCDVSTKNNPDKVPFHEFPSNSEYLEKWLTAIPGGLMRKVRGNDTGRSRVLCGQHFLHQHYIPGTRRLNYQNAVPVIHQRENSNESEIMTSSNKRFRADVSETELDDSLPQQFRDRDLGERENPVYSTQASQDARAMQVQPCLIPASNQENLIGLEQLCSVSRESRVENEDETDTQSSSHNELNETELRRQLSSIRRALRKIQLRNNNLADAVGNKKVKKLRRSKLLKNLRRVLIRRNRQLKNLRSRLNKVGRRIFEKIECLSNDYSERASARILRDQIRNYGNKVINRRNSWTEDTIRYCIISQAKSPANYRFMRTQMACLPHPSTLRRYMGPSFAETGVTPLVKQRLALESKRLKKECKLGSIIIDTMTIKPSLKYLKNLDKFFGIAEGNADDSSPRLANQLLAFVFTGLAGSLRFPVAYYLTKDITGEELYRITLEVIREVEASGMSVVRIVTDNHSTNVKMYKQLNGKGELTHIVKHPCDTTNERSLFLAFDYCHIIKNVRNQFLDKTFMFDGNEVSFRYVRRLYDLQRDSVMKAARFLTRKHVNPDNLERQKVKLAVDVFRPEVRHSLALMKSFNYHGFEGVEHTIRFMEMMFKWWEINDVSNNTQHYRQRLANKRHFTSLSDERLAWLSETFLPSITTWCSNNPVKQRLSQETYEAIIMTTKSNVECIKYLLKEGFFFVLTRKFNSDPVEQLFSSIRQLCGANDRTDAFSCVNSLEKILRTGICYASLEGNTSVDESAAESAGLGRNKRKLTKPSGGMECKYTLESLPSEIVSILGNLTSETNAVPNTPEGAGVIYTAGYLIRTLYDHELCDECCLRLEQPVSSALKLIYDQDRGALTYPSQSFSYCIWTVYQFVIKALPLLHKTSKLLDGLVNYLAPWLLKVPLFGCLRTKVPNVELVTCILVKFIKPLLSNYGNTTTEVQEKKKVVNYSKNRKYAKVRS